LIHGARAKAQADPNCYGQSKIALDLIGRLFRIEIRTATVSSRLLTSLSYLKHPKATSVDQFESLQLWNILCVAARVNS
jgi:hypothetical protein